MYTGSCARTVVLAGGNGDGVGDGGFQSAVHRVHVGQPLRVAHLPEAPLMERRQRPRALQPRHRQRPLPLHPPLVLFKYLILQTNGYTPFITDVLC